MHYFIVKIQSKQEHQEISFNFLPDIAFEYFMNLYKKYVANHILSALSSRNVDKYEYLAGEEILPSDQIRVIELAKFTYSFL